MSSLLNPLHPGTLFLQKKLGQQGLSSMQITMPPGTSLTFQIGPPAGTVWIAAIQAFGPPRDIATGTIVISPLITAYGRHSMAATSIQQFGLESFNRTPWGIELDLRSNDPVVSTLSNGTALTIIFDFSLAVLVITEDKYDQYMRLWNGLYNLEIILGGLQETDVDNLVNVLRTAIPTATTATIISEEIKVHPTMGEDIGKPIKRIAIP